MRLANRTWWDIGVSLMTYCSFQLGGCTLLLSCNLRICLPTYNSAINWSMKIFFCHYSSLRAFWEVPVLGDFKWLFISDSFIIHTWHKHYSHCYVFFLIIWCSKYSFLFGMWERSQVPRGMISVCDSGKCRCAIKFVCINIHQGNKVWTRKTGCDL